MYHKFFALLGFVAIACCSPTLYAQSPSPSASPAKHGSHKKADTKASADKTTTAATSATPVPGGGHGLVWVDDLTHLYHQEGSVYYGKTKKGKYVTETEATEQGNHPAKD
jgi:hypothetical protein